MLSSLITNTSTWFIPLCFFVGFLYAFVLYRKDKKLVAAKKITRSILFGFRFITTSFIAFLLLTPMIKSVNKTIEKPILIFAQDNSESINTDSVSLNKYKIYVADFLEKLSLKYTVNSFSFGEKVQRNKNYTFNEKLTNISDLLTETQNKYIGRNVGALILASDGIYNDGINPVYQAKEFPFPIYTIATGQSDIKPDVILTGVKHNKIAFLNNKFPVQAVISAKKMQGKSTEIKILDNTNKILFSEKIKIDKPDFYKKIDFNIAATKLGVAQYKVEITPIDGESILKNNTQTIAIEIINNKKKILLLANAPHPDISALQEALLLNKNFEIEFSTVSNFKKSIKPYSLVVLYQLPSVNNSITNILKEIGKEKTAVLYMIGNQTDTRKFDNLNLGLKINQQNRNTDEAQAIFNPSFNLFKLNEELSAFVKNAPPLISPFGKYEVSAKTEILFTKSIKNISTQQPLFLFAANTTSNAGKVAIIAGEGIWKWRIYDFQENENHYLFNELINKTIQYLSLQQNKERFTVFTEKIVPENQEIKFEAQLYNRSFELVNYEDINLTITDTSNAVLNYILNKTQNAYTLNTGVFAPGKYNWSASTRVDGKKQVKVGTFTVVPVNIEAENSTANPKLMHQISDETGAEMFYPTQLDSLLIAIEKNKNIVPISFSEKKTKSLLSLKYLFFALLILLSAEWFIRKYNGGY